VRLKPAEFGGEYRLRRIESSSHCYARSSPDEFYKPLGATASLNQNQTKVCSGLSRRGEEPQFWRSSATHFATEAERYLAKFKKKESNSVASLLLPHGSLFE